MVDVVFGLIEFCQVICCFYVGVCWFWIVVGVFVSGVDGFFGVIGLVVKFSCNLKILLLFFWC